MGPSLRLLDSIRFKQKEVGEDHPPNTHRKGEFWLLSAFLLLQGADNEGGFGLISAFFCCRGRGTKACPFYVKWAEISTFRQGGGRRADFRLGPQKQSTIAKILLNWQTKLSQRHAK